MGRVFSWIEIASRQVPRISSFDEVHKLTIERLGRCDEVIGAISCGSFLRRDYTIRSDLDYLVLYESKHRKKIVMLLQDLAVAARAKYVPLKAIPFDNQITKTPFHHIGPLFAAHLRWAAESGGVVKKDPLQFFSFGHTTPDEDVKGYFRNKLRRLEEGLSELPVMDDSELYRFLQKVLEAPLRIAQKVLLWHGIELLSGAKKEITECYTKNMNDHEVGWLKKLVAVDQKYSLELKRQIETPDQLSYSRAIEEIKELAWEVLDFVHFNALMFRE